MVKNNNKLRNKKEKKLNKIKEQLARLREKLSVSENKQSSFFLEHKFKKIQAKANQAKNKKFQVIEAQRKSKEAKKKEARIKAEAKKKETRIKAEVKKKETRIKEEAKKKETRIKVEAQRKSKKAKIVAQRKSKEAKKKEARIKVEAQRKAKEEAKRKEEEAKKKEEEAKRTYEDELEEQLSEEEITGFQLEKTDMDKMCNRVCEMIAGYETNGTLQSELWKKLKLSSRDGSRLALKLERMGMITREKILEKERWTYKLIIKKIPVSTKSIEGAPCLTCPVQSKCSIDGEISPKTCQWIEDWVMIELKNK